MYAFVKSIISEKDILRKVNLLEALFNDESLTTNQLAEYLSVTQRTVFNDLHDIRDQLPTGWTIQSNGNKGLQLKHSIQANTLELWLPYIKKAMSVQLVKQLLRQRTIKTQMFIHEEGISYESLRRAVQQLNQVLGDYHIRIRLTPTTIMWVGQELSIRLFYHRLLLTFSNSSFFFPDYQIQQFHYQRFTKLLKRYSFCPANDTLYGSCWFMINCIRIKAGCSIEHFSFSPADPLFLIFREDLVSLYQKEGVYLQGDEIFFAFYCFLESWFFDQSTAFKIVDVIKRSYPLINSQTALFTKKISQILDVPLLLNSKLSDILLIFFLKYIESRELTQAFYLEFPEVYSSKPQYIADLQKKIKSTLINMESLQITDHSNVLARSLYLLIHQVLAELKHQKKTVYFFFQGDLSWRHFLLQEFKDLLGPRVLLISLDFSDIDSLVVSPDTYIITNMLWLFKTNVQGTLLPISMRPTKDEILAIQKKIGIHLSIYK